MPRVRKLDIAREIPAEDRALAYKISRSESTGDPDVASLSRVEIERAWKEADVMAPAELESLERLTRLFGVAPPGAPSPKVEPVFGPPAVDAKTGRPLRSTRIVCTIGPACADAKVLAKMIGAGMDVARLNFSHIAKYDDAEALVSALREAMQIAGRKIEILADLQGPKIRVGALDAPMAVVAGSTVVLSASASSPSDARLEVAPPAILGSISPGARILIDDGKVLLRAVERLPGGDVRAEVVRGGFVSSKKGLNLPDTPVTGLVPTEKDLRDLESIRKLGIHLIAVSFVHDAADLQRVREAFGAPVKLVSKIETPAALANLEEITRASDALMVARGDLAVEVGDVEVPIAQKKIHTLGNRADVPTGTATEMLESMTDGGPPTRAEVSDVARAVLEGSDFVMTSAETSVGKDPVGVVEKMAEIVMATERAMRSGTIQGRGGF